MDQTTVSRRRALQTGTLTALGIGLMAAAGSPPAVVGAQPAPTIEDAERLILELAGILPHLSTRDASNVSHVLDELGQAAGSRADLVAGAVADALADIGPGNRVHDRMDQDIAAARRAAVTHAMTVERYAERYADGEVGSVFIAIRQELVATYGEDLGEAIADAAFHRYLHDRHAHSGDLDSCSRCWD